MEEETEKPIRSNRTTGENENGKYITCDGDEELEAGWKNPHPRACFLPFIGEGGD